MSNTHPHEQYILHPIHLIHARASGDAVCGLKPVQFSNMPHELRCAIEVSDGTVPPGVRYQVRVTKLPDIVGYPRSFLTIMKCKEAKWNLAWVSDDSCQTMVVFRCVTQGYSKSPSSCEQVHGGSLLLYALICRGTFLSITQQQITNSSSVYKKICNHGEKYIVIKGKDRAPGVGQHV